MYLHVFVFTGKVDTAVVGLKAELTFALLVVVEIFSVVEAFVVLVDLDFVDFEEIGDSALSIVVVCIFESIFL